MKIAYVSYWSAKTIAFDGWSGTSYHIAKTLQDQGFALNYIHFVPQTSSLITWIMNHFYHFFENKSISPLLEFLVFNPNMIGKTKKYFYHILKNKEYLPYLELSFIEGCARKIERQVSYLNPDIVFIPGYLPSYLPVAYLSINKPIIIWGDATYYLLKDYLIAYNNLASEALDNWRLVENVALKKSKLIIYPTAWAAQSAINRHQISPHKVKVIPFGANIPSQLIPSNAESIIESRESKKCKLLFIGRDWDAKGGDIAYAVAKKLNKIGLKTDLTVVGSMPVIDEPIPNFVQVHGFIDKNTITGLRKLIEIISESHFLIHPSNAECFGIVFCEANSFGVPCLARRTGGVPWIIKDGVNGKTFEDDGIIDAMCNYIIEHMKNKDKYQKLALSAFDEYKTVLNWEVSGKKVKNLLLNMI